MNHRRDHADTVFMKRSFFAGVVLVSVFMVLPLVVVPAQPITVVNGEMAPFFYITVDSDVVRPDSDTEVLQQRLREHPRQIRVIAPGNMVRLDQRNEILLGYYGGDASSLAMRAVILPIPPEAPVLTVDRTSLLRRNGQPVVFSSWDIPAQPYPIVLGAGQQQWLGADEVFSFSPVAVPRRLEDTLRGSEISLSEAVFWRVGGTAVRRVLSVGAAGAWFLRLQVEGPILDNTGYHLTLFLQEQQWRYHGELVVLVDGRSGPVAFHTADGEMLWAGQYLEREGAVELQIEGSFLADMPPGEQIRVDLATSHRGRTRSERFVLGSFHVAAER